MPQISVTTPETIDVLGAPMTIIAETGASSTIVIDHPVPPGYGVPLHVHPDEDEAFFILEGELTLLDGHGETKAEPGALVRLPRGIPHGFRNDTKNTARMLVLCGPQAAEMFHHLHRARPGMEDVPMICGHYGVVFAPPASP